MFYSTLIAVCISANPAAAPAPAPSDARALLAALANPQSPAAGEPAPPPAPPPPVRTVPAAGDSARADVGAYQSAARLVVVGIVGAAALAAVAFAIRRVRRGKGRRAALLSVEETIVLGRGLRLAVVSAAGRRVLIGIAGTAITNVCDLGPAAPPGTAPPEPDVCRDEAAFEDLFPLELARAGRADALTRERVIERLNGI